MIRESSYRAERRKMHICIILLDLVAAERRCKHNRDVHNTCSTVERMIPRDLCWSYDFGLWWQGIRAELPGEEEDPHIVVDRIGNEWANTTNQRNEEKTYNPLPWCWPSRWMRRLWKGCLVTHRCSAAMTITLLLAIIQHAMMWLERERRPTRSRHHYYGYIPPMVHSAETFQRHLKSTSRLELFCLSYPSSGKDRTAPSTAPTPRQFWKRKATYRRSSYPIVLCLASAQPYC
jgi:hypothetical protein